MGASLQLIHCKKCNESYLVGINRADVRKIKPESGMLGDDPWIAIGQEQIENGPRIDPGDRVPCPKCKTECIVEEPGYEGG